MSNECIWCGKTDTNLFVCRCYEGKRFKTINWNKFKQLNQVRKNFLEIKWREYLYYRYVYKYCWRIIDKKGNK